MLYVIILMGGLLIGLACVIYSLHVDYKLSDADNESLRFQLNECEIVNSQLVKQVVKAEQELRQLASGGR